MLGPEDFATGVQRDNIFRELRRLKKLQFVVNYRASGKGKKFTIETFTRNGAAQEFFERRIKDTDKVEKISVAQYYTEQYNIRLRFPNLPLIRTKKRNEMYPMELALVEEGQRYPYKLNDRQTADMIKFTVTVSSSSSHFMVLQLTVSIEAS